MNPGRSRHPGWRSLPGSRPNPDKRTADAPAMGRELENYDKFTWPSAPHASAQGHGAAHSCHNIFKVETQASCPSKHKHAFANFCFSNALAPAKVARAPQPEYPAGAWHALPTSLQPARPQQCQDNDERGMAKCTIWTSCFIVGFARFIIQAVFASSHPAT